MDYRYLRVFLDAADTLSFSQTAKNQRIAPSAVTRQIQLFEESVGEPLFVRSNQRVVLTEKGREIVEAAGPLEKWNMEQKRRTIRVAGLVGAMEALFWPQVLKAKLFDQMNFDVFACVSRDAIRMIEDGEVDIAFVNRKEESSLVSYFHLTSESFVLISKDSVSLDDLKNETWIYGESGESLRQLSGIKGDHPFIRVTSLKKIYELVEAGVGVAVVTESSVPAKWRFAKKKLSLKAKPIYLAVPNYSRMPAHLKILYEVVKN
jgi:DNA-binding transcriptional LysR family regulator